MAVDPSGTLKRARTLGWQAGVALLVALAALTGAACDSRRAVVQTDVPTYVADAVAFAFPEHACVSPAIAATTISNRLEAVPGNEWTVVSSEEALASRCATAGLDENGNAVVLIPITAPEVQEAVRGVADLLMDRCLGRDAAVGLLTSVLRRFGIAEASIQTNGPLAHPIGEGDAVRAHIAEGCFVYSGSGQAASGDPAYYLSGPN